MLQLAAYCLLVEEHTGQRPRHGLLRYRETTFRIPYNRRLRARLLATLEQMRSDAACASVPRTHADATRCRLCGLRPYCDESLL
jgi:CRISPR-associated exonuclease Cas4